MDLRMPGMDGVTAIKRLAALGLDARVLVLTTYDTDSDVLPAIEAGATGYLLKDAPRGELLRAVRAAARGEAVLSPSVATRLLGQVRAPAAGPLSNRELDVLALVAAGTTNREAAARLFISEATVKTHLLHIYAKLGVNDRAAAVATGFERGLLPRGRRLAGQIAAEQEALVLDQVTQGERQAAGQRGAGQDAPGLARTQHRADRHAQLVQRPAAANWASRCGPPSHSTRRSPRSASASSAAGRST